MTIIVAKTGRRMEISASFCMCANRWQVSTQCRRATNQGTPSPPSDGGEGRGEEGRSVRTPLSSVLSPLLRRGERKKRQAPKTLRKETTQLRPHERSLTLAVAVAGC